MDWIIEEIKVKYYTFEKKDKIKLKLLKNNYYKAGQNNTPKQLS